MELKGKGVIGYDVSGLFVRVFFCMLDGSVISSEREGILSRRLLFFVVVMEDLLKV